jgi:hypothetical protein
MGEYRVVEAYNGWRLGETWGVYLNCIALSGKRAKRTFTRIIIIIIIIVT